MGADHYPTAHAGRTAAWLSKQVELGLDEVGLTLPQYRILWLLDAGPSISSTLAGRLAVRPPTVTAVVDGLAGRGLVERRHSERDRRQVAHILTERGRRVLRQADEAVEQRLAAIAGCLPNKDATRRALDSLDLWQQALLAHRQQMVVARK